MKTKHMRQVKIAALVEEIKKVATTIRFLLLILVAVLIPATFLSSVFFPTSPSSLSDIKSERKSLSNQIDIYTDSIVSVASTSSKADIIILQNHLANIKTKKAALELVYKPLKKSKYISGFPSLHKFLWNFGIGLIMLSLSIYLLATTNMYEGNRRKAANAASMLFVTASGFYMAWIVFPEDDLPKKTYFTVLFAIGFLAAISAYWINKVNFLTRAKLKGKIRFAMNLMVIKAIDLGLIKNIEDYTRKIVNPAIDKLDE